MCTHRIRSAELLPHANPKGMLVDMMCYRVDELHIPVPAFMVTLLWWKRCSDGRVDVDLVVMSVGRGIIGLVEMNSDCQRCLLQSGWAAIDRARERAEKDVIVLLKAKGALDHQGALDEEER